MASDEAPLTGRRVLLVEDDYFIAASLCMQLQDSGAQILGPVPSIREALALIAASPDIDAAVLDIGLQDEMAFPVAEALQARGIPFLFATGYDESVIPSRYADVRHCMKPVLPTQVVQTLLSA